MNGLWVIVRLDLLRGRLDTGLVMVSQAGIICLYSSKIAAGGPACCLLVTVTCHDYSTLLLRYYLSTYHWKKHVQNMNDEQPRGIKSL